MTCPVVKRGKKAGCDPGKSVEKKGEREAFDNPSGSSSHLPLHKGGFGCGAFPGRKMKREFLQSLQEDQPLSKAVIDAIMAENGKDIQATRALFADYEGLKQELESARQTIAQLEEGNQKALEEKARQVEFSYLLKQAVKDSGGRNQKAVEALLDLEDLQKADKPEAALQDAINALQKEHPWLFQTQTPPPYAAFTGTQNPKANAPATLAGALRERFERNSF